MDYEYLLKKYSSYASVPAKMKNDFVYLSRDADEQLLKLYINHGLARYEKGGGEIDIFFKIVRWSHEILLYEKNEKYTGVENAVSIIDFCIKNKVTVNCRKHAVVLTEALLSMGYAARIVCCLPIDVSIHDNHAITAVYSSQLNKWLALDPSRNCCFLDDGGQILSVAEIRRLLINNEKIHFKYFHRFKKMDTNSKLVQFDDDWYLDYLYKNFFRFYCSRVNRSTDKISPYAYHLVPTGYAEVNKERVFCGDSVIPQILMVTDDTEAFWAKPNG